MEREDTSGQQTPADFLLMEGGEDAAPCSAPCQHYGSTLLPLKDWQRAWAKGKKIIAKQRFKNPLERSKLLLCAAAVCYTQGPSAPPGACALWGCSETVLQVRCLLSRSQHSRLGQARGGCQQRGGPGVPVLLWGGTIAASTVAARIRSQQLEAGAGSLFRVKKH